MFRNTYQNPTAITEFRGTYAFLSNFYQAPVHYRGYLYANNEAAFQAQKTTNPKIRLQFCFPHMKNAADAKKLGRRIELRHDWESIKLSCMYEICLAKFMQHPELAEALLRTDDCELIEGNTWGDRYWGTVDAHGENQLGQILMDIRKKLQMQI